MDIERVLTLTCGKIFEINQLGLESDCVALYLKVFKMVSQKEIFQYFSEGYYHIFKMKNEAFSSISSNVKTKFV